MAREDDVRARCARRSSSRAIPDSPPLGTARSPCASPSTRGWRSSPATSMPSGLGAAWRPASRLLAGARGRVGSAPPPRGSSATRCSARPAAEPWRCREAAPDTARAARSPFVGRSAESAPWPIVIAAPRRGGDRPSCSSASPASGSRDSWTSSWRRSPGTTPTAPPRRSAARPITPGRRCTRSRLCCGGSDPWRAAARACGLPAVETALLETQLAPAGAAPQNLRSRCRPRSSSAACSARSRTSCSGQLRHAWSARLRRSPLGGSRRRSLCSTASSGARDGTGARASDAATRARPGVGVGLLRDGRDARPAGCAGARGARGRAAGRHAAARGLVPAIEERSDGVPLFAEELVLALRDAGTLRRTQAGWSSRPARWTRRARDAARSAPRAPGSTRRPRVVAQVGAVLGRRFDRELLEAVAGLDERTVDEGSPGSSTPSCSMSAAAVRPRAMSSSTPSSVTPPMRRSCAPPGARCTRAWRAPSKSGGRQRVRRAGGPRPSPRRRGDHAAAADWWLRAGALALREPAYVEAIDHYEAGRAAAGVAGEAPLTVELDLQLGLGTARMAALGYAAEATEEAYARAEQLSRSSRTPRGWPWRCTAWPSTPARTASSGVAVSSACGCAASPRRPVTRTPRSKPTSCSPSRAASAASSRTASPPSAGARAWDPQRHRCHMFSFGQEPGVAIYAGHVFLLGLTGRIDEARRVGAEGLDIARRIGHPLSSPICSPAWASPSSLPAIRARRAFRRRAAGADDGARPRDVARLGGHPLRVGARAGRGPAGGLAAAQVALEARAEIGFLGMQPHFLAVVAELAVDAGRLDVAQTLLAEGRPLLAESSESGSPSRSSSGSPASSRSPAATATTRSARSSVRSSKPGSWARRSPPCTRRASWRSCARSPVSPRTPERWWPPRSTRCRSGSPPPRSRRPGRCSTASPCRPCPKRRSERRTAARIGPHAASLSAPRRGVSTSAAISAARNPASGPTPPI